MTSNTGTTDPGHKDLLCELDGRGVLTLTLNRPQVHNAFGDSLIAELLLALQNASTNPKVRLIVLTGAGSSFSAGADLNWMRNMISASACENEQDALKLAAMLRHLNYHDKPTIARVNGSAFGGGVGLLACCDIVIATDQAEFSLSEVRLGLVPAIISPYVFRRMGERCARRYFLNGERFHAGQALVIGLVQEICAADELDQQVNRQVSLLLQAGPEAVNQAKRLVFEAAGLNPEIQHQQDQKNARLIAGLRVSAEGQEGLTAFLQRRKPSWFPDKDA